MLWHDLNIHPNLCAIKAGWCTWRVAPPPPNTYAKTYNNIMHIRCNNTENVTNISMINDTPQTHHGFRQSNTIHPQGNDANYVVHYQETYPALSMLLVGCPPDELSSQWPAATLYPFHPYSLFTGLNELMLTWDYCPRIPAYFNHILHTQSHYRISHIVKIALFLMAVGENMRFPWNQGSILKLRTRLLT